MILEPHGDLTIRNHISIDIPIDIPFIDVTALSQRLHLRLDVKYYLKDVNSDSLGAVG